MSILVQGEFIVSYIFRVEIILCLIRRNISLDTVYIVFLIRRNIILKGIYTYIKRYCKNIYRMSNG